MKTNKRPTCPLDVRILSNQQKKRLKTEQMNIPGFDQFAVTSPGKSCFPALSNMDVEMIDKKEDRSRLHNSPFRTSPPQKDKETFNSPPSPTQQETHKPWWASLQYKPIYISWMDANNNDLGPSFQRGGFSRHRWDPKELVRSILDDVMVTYGHYSDFAKEDLKLWSEDAGKFITTETWAEIGKVERCFALNRQDSNKQHPTGLRPFKGIRLHIINYPPRGCVRLFKCLPKGKERDEMSYSQATKKLDGMIKMVKFHAPSLKTLRAVKLLLDTAMQARAEQALWRKFLFSSLDDVEDIIPIWMLMGLFMGILALCGEHCFEFECGHVCAPPLEIKQKNEVPNYAPNFAFSSSVCFQGCNWFLSIHTLSQDIPKCDREI